MKINSIWVSKNFTNILFDINDIMVKIHGKFTIPSKYNDMTSGVNGHHFQYTKYKLDKYYEESIINNMSASELKAICFR